MHNIVRLVERCSGTTSDKRKRQIDRELKVEFVIGGVITTIVLGLFISSLLVAVVEYIGK